MAKNGNKQLGRAKRAKEDEFYTRLEDIERELSHYKGHFRGKTVLCNCDDPRVSNFFHYFAYQFEALGLKRLITTCYKNQTPDSQKRMAYERQKGVCPKCGLHFDYGQMEGDHITPWSEGGHTIPANLQMLCRDCNRRKGAK